RDERVALDALGVHIAVALENARLTSRQRRFAEELERSVASATRRLEELDRAKSAFVAVASHELRTPLTALQGFSEILAAPSLPPVDADPDALERILTNLVSNAVKYSPPGSEVRLCARRAGAMVEVAVLDRGAGIPGDALARIFEPYYRVPATSTVRGTGLGLAVV